MRSSFMNRENIKRWIVFGMLATLAMLILGSPGCGSNSPIPPQEGAQAPDFSLSTLDGGTVELDELKGQPVFLSFWSINCQACRLQMPYIQAAFEEKGQEIQFIAIDSVDSSGAVQQYTEYYGLGFTMALDSYGKAARAYNIRYSPTNLIIDKEGVIKHLKVGRFASTDEVLSLLEDL
jgi:peroxiredoxin